MGITIFARGHVDCIDEIPNLIEMVSEFADRLGWRYSIIDDDFGLDQTPRLVPPDAGGPAVIKGTLGVKGIVVFGDPGCESLALLFKRSGELTSPAVQLFSADEMEPFTSCKTQFGSIDSHVCIAELLQAVKERFMTDLEVNDEGGYWDNRDLEELSEKRSVLEHYQDHVAKVVGKLAVTTQEKLEAGAVASRLETALAEAEKGKVVL